MAEIEAGLLAKLQHESGGQERPALVGFLRSRPARIGTLIEAVDGQSLKELERAIKKKGGKKIKVFKEIQTIYAEMPVEHVKDLADIACAQKIYDAEGEITPFLYESVPLVMGVERATLPYRVNGKPLEGQGIKIAVIDSGLARHPDFGWRVARRKNFSGSKHSKGTEHGTHVAGIIAGSGKASGFRQTGIAPKARLYDVKIFKDGVTPTSRDKIIAATLWAVKRKVHVINMSFGDSHGCGDGSCLLCKVADYAVKQGVTVVAAAGNLGPAQGTITCPGNAKGVITVGAATKTTPPKVLGFSSRGASSVQKPDVVAPGVQIVAPQPGGQYGLMSGTSMAAPHVSGLAALLYQAERQIYRRKQIAPAKIKETLKRGCTNLNEHTSAQGGGLINFKKEIELLQAAVKHSWFSLKRTPRPAIFPLNQLPPEVAPAALADVAVEPAQTCPAVLNMFCPHYNAGTCDRVFQNCIHFQTAQQERTLRVLHHI